jgi:hypothetical protein
MENMSSMYDLRLSQLWLWRISSSGMWRCVDLALTDVSEEHVTSIFRVGKSASGEPAWAGGCRLSQPWSIPCRLYTSLCYLLLTFITDLTILSVDSPVAILPLSLFLYSWLSLTGGSVCSHLLTLVHRSRIFLLWRWRRYFPPKRRLKQDLHSATSQKTSFFNMSSMYAFLA